MTETEIQELIGEERQLLRIHLAEATRRLCRTGLTLNQARRTLQCSALKELSVMAECWSIRLILDTLNDFEDPQNGK